MSVDAKTARFDLVTLDDSEALMTYDRVDPGTAPDGIYLYEIQHKDDDKPVFLQNNAGIGFYGSLLINQQLDVGETGLYIEDGLGFTGRKCSLAKYMKENPVQAQADGQQMGGMSQ